MENACNPTILDVQQLDNGGKDTELYAPKLGSVEKEYVYYLILDNNSLEPQLGIDPDTAKCKKVEVLNRSLTREGGFDVKDECGKEYKSIQMNQLYLNDQLKEINRQTGLRKHNEMMNRGGSKRRKRTSTRRKKTSSRRKNTSSRRKRRNK
jgi:hypothetical protein